MWSTDDDELPFILGLKKSKVFLSLSITVASGCGENLYMSSYKNSWSNAIQAWYDEVKDWRYGVGSVNGGVVGHFTQVHFSHLSYKKL